MTHVWLRNPDTGGAAQFSEESVDAWRARGWVDSDPPPESDTTKDPAPPDDGGAFSSPEQAGDETAEAVPATEDVAEDGEQGQETSTRAGRRKRDSVTAE